MVENESITTSTFIRWMIGALAVLVMTGAGFWGNAIYGQLDRIEKSLTLRVEKIESSLEALKQQGASSADKSYNTIVDLKIETALQKARIDQLEKEYASARHEITDSQNSKKQK